MENLFNIFSLAHEKEEVNTVLKRAEDGVVFRGTNLYILIFAIFVASLGLNVNSTAVIIGAMLISPLMGPIMGIGLGLGVNDGRLYRKALYNYLIATAVALATSTVFFLLSPLNDAHSEILARTSPNIYDVLIALFGGLAGMLATASTSKGNVIPGAAIATALMPPLCTAGYGLATLQFSFFYGAFYLYIINTVFIALAAFIVARMLRFPVRSFADGRETKKTRWVGWLIVLVTLLPSIYFGYDMVRKARFTAAANRFVEKEAVFDNDFLLQKQVDAEKRLITLVFGGREITVEEIGNLKARMASYPLEGATVEVQQGFKYLAEEKKDKDLDTKAMFSFAMDAQARRSDSLQRAMDSISQKSELSSQLFREIKAQYPNVISAVIQPVHSYSDSAVQTEMLVMLRIKGKISAAETEKLNNWLRQRLLNQQVNLVINR